MSLISTLLRKNTSPARVAGFVLSNFIGLVIVIGALQFYLDARSLWTSSDSFIRSDYMVLNKEVTSANTLGSQKSAFSEAEISDLKAQPWVRDVGRFSSADYRILASVEQGGKSMSTYMFFEAIPDKFVDVPAGQWHYTPGSGEVPIILSKDYLTLYNFGFAPSAGLPQLSEGLMSSIPLTLRLTSNDGTRTLNLHGRVAGYSNRLNTILVPQDFMEQMNRDLGERESRDNGSGGSVTSRVIVDVSSPGDVAIKPYLKEHGLEVAGDKSASSASFLLKVVVGIVMAVGAVITILSLSILLLSLSLIMEKNRDKIHSLLMLGYDPAAIERPYRQLTIWASAAACLLAVGGMLLLRMYYMTPISGLGAHPAGVWASVCTAVALTAIVICCNIIAIHRRVLSTWR